MAEVMKTLALQRPKRGDTLPFVIFETASYRAVYTMYGELVIYVCVGAETPKASWKPVSEEVNAALREILDLPKTVPVAAVVDQPPGEPSG